MSQGLQRSGSQNSKISAWSDRDAEYIVPHYRNTAKEPVSPLKDDDDNHPFPFTGSTIAQEQSAPLHRRPSTPYHYHGAHGSSTHPQAHHQQHHNPAHHETQLTAPQNPAHVPKARKQGATHVGKFKQFEK
ncbi:hypothetical protein OIO90_005538 [Microbotryomycetes sp. JL221]|nr:hypothetical protein OIO90_005538 [Microbotryomycetes sp. JL221]